MTWLEIDRWEPKFGLSPGEALGLLSKLAADSRWWNGVVVTIVTNGRGLNYSISLWENKKYPSVIADAPSLSVAAERAALKCYWNEDGSMYGV